MKRFVLLFFMLSLGLSVFCAPVSVQTAQRAAESYWAQMNGGKVSFAASQTEFVEFYVFNNQIGEGFVLVSADDIAHPILGYSDKGSFRTDVQLPVNVRGWFKGISKEISSAVDLGIQQSEEVREEWNSLLEGTPYPKRSTRAVSALLSTTWDQGKPYNNLCPADSNTDSYYGGRTVTGCVATAMAQVMKYWNYPAQGNGSHSYTHSTYGTQSANFGTTTYAWTNMPNNLTTYSSSAQKTAVATLMYHCGVAVDMQYDIAENGGSGAYTVVNYGNTPCAKNALVTYFKYKNTIQGLFRQSYSDTNWKNLLKADLDAGRPIMYSGASDEGGHSFVCDGYNNNDQFHFNWGWSGSYDGFFSLNAMTPGSGGIGGGGYDFSEDQDAIIGIEPAGITVSPSTVQLPSAGGSATVSVTAGTASSSWSATSSANWVTFTPTTGSGNGAATTMTISASANNTGSTRTATITLTQGSQTATVSVSQLDGTISLDGWYGNISGYDNIVDITATHEIIIRPEQFGTFEPGNKVLKVKFATYQTSTGNYASYNNNSFTLRIYEGTNLDNGLVTNGYSMTSNVLNTPVYTQNYTQTPDSESSITENTITLNTPYTLNNNNFWISIVANGPTLFLYEEETIGSPVATASFQSDYTQANYDYLYTETYTQNNTDYELINANYVAGYTDNSQAYVQAASMNFALAFYLSEDGTYTETTDFQAELFGGVSGGYLQEAPASYSLSATDNLIIYPFFKNAGPDAATSGTITVAIKLNGNTYTSSSNDASQLSVGSWYSMASSGYSVTIPASDMDNLNLTGNFNVCVELTYSGTDPDLNNNSHCIPVTRQEPSANNLSVSPSSLSYTAAGESKTVTVTSNTSWTATSSASWLTISPASGSNNGTITAVAAANTSSSQRTATITVSASGISSQTISVTQAGTSGGGETGDCVVLHEDRFDSPAIYSAQDNGGYVCGSNSYGDQAKAEYFELSGNYNITSIDFAYAIDGTNGSVTFKVWANNNGVPGSELASQTVTLSNLYSAATSQNGTMVGSYTWTLSSPVAVSTNFFAGFDVSNATSYIGLLSTQQGSGYTNSCYELYNGSWGDMYTNWQSLDISMYVLPTVCPTSTPSYNLTVNPSSLSYTAAGETKTVTVTSNTSWTATSSANWLTVSPASGSNNGTITAVAAANTSSSQRTATITVSGSGITRTISVTQAGVSYNLIVNPTSLSYTANGETKTVTVTSNTSWTATSSASWLTVSPASGSNNGTITAVAAANTSTQQRTATITVSGSGITRTINVTQAGAPTAIDEEVAEGISVYPNPTSGMFTVGLGSIEGKVTCQIVNVRGAVIETKDVNAADGSEVIFDTNVAAGVYFVRIISGDSVWTERVVIEK